LTRLLLLTIVLIAYASLYPWHFHAYYYADSPLWVLWHSWPVQLNRFDAKDIAVNVLVYLPLGFFAFAALASIRRIWVAAILALLIGIGLSLSMEIAQLFVEGRITSLLDVFTNTFGAAAGIVAGCIWRAHRDKSKVSVRSDAMFAIACWALYQLFPFFPHRGGPRLLSAPPAVDALLYFASVVALMPLVDVLCDTARRRRLVFTALVILAPLKMFIFMRGVTVVELVSTAMAAAAALLLPVRAWAAAGVLGIAVVLHGLAPFTFQETAQRFSWLPFQAAFASDWAQALVVLLGKVFVYGSLLWLIRESGVRLAFAAASVVAVLGAIEVAQMYLPGRSPEITDPVIALILAWVFWSLAPRQAGAGETQ
jgi:VanZ family protein